MWIRLTLMVLATWVGLSLADAQAQMPYRLPDLGERFKDRIIWGSQAESPDGFALAFGGQDQVSDDGIGHTRFKQTDGEWKLLVKSANQQKSWRSRESIQKVLNGHRFLLSIARSAYFDALPGEDAQRMNDILKLELARERVLISVVLQGLETDSGKDIAVLELAKHLQALAKLTESLEATVQKQGNGPRVLESLLRMQHQLEQVLQLTGAEPPPRALSPIVYEPTTRLFFLFGGDHFDYLMNDTWVFDSKGMSWSLRRQNNAPRPRANHTLKATGDGKIVLTGGYTYSSNTDYLGGQYVDLDDGPWVYDVEKNTWSGDGPMVDSLSRTYRSGPFHPTFYYEPKPDRDAHQKVLDALPANRWVKLNPPKLPRLNRDWGTAVLDPDRDLILRFSGGHSAHGGTDVLHYHIATNRWELCYPVEFPLGQLYANTRYPNGFNFNGRPWVTGHTYQNYGYDVRLKKMLFSGRPEYTYIYDIDRGDWDGRFKKPNEMIYNSCFYTLTHCRTPQGLVCWTKQGELFRFDAETMNWASLPVKAGKLPGAVVDNSTLTYDSRRNRLLFFVKGFGNQRKYDGQIHAYELATGEVTQLSPAGRDAIDPVMYLCQIRYDETNDLLLVGATLPPGDSGLRRTPAYDPVNNRWISLKITGDDPSGDKGRNVSLGMMYEPKRKLILAVDTNSQVYALRLEPKSADVQPVER